MDGIPSTTTIDGSKLRSLDRLNVVAKEIERIVQLQGITLAVIEGYAMGFGGKNPGRVFDIGELGGVLKLTLWRMGVPLMVIPPKTLKCLIADSGNAKKDDMINALRTNYGFVTK